MNALLSIEPEFAEKILDGEKQYEFRRTAFRDPSAVEKVILYASSPVQLIIGFFSIGDVIEDTPQKLWNRYGSESGINRRERFMDYFSGKATGYAIEIEDTVQFQTPVNPWEHLDDFYPPMSFNYVNSEFDFLLKAPKIDN